MSSREGGTLPSNPSAPSGPEAGSILLGKYRVEKLLGAGGMGRVFEVTHLGLHQSFAIKLLPSGSADENGTARLLREARNSAQVKNEHAVRVVDVGALDDGAPYIVMELLSGEDLSRVLKREERFPTPRAVEWLLQACEAVAEAHVMGLVHRDLKPSNLFLTKTSTGEAFIKVLDFGLSKSIDSDSMVTTTASILGTPAYMSPEQLRSSRDADARSDIWALGVVLYEFLTGVLPFPGASPAEIAAGVFRDPPQPFPANASVPDGLKKVVFTCLQKDPLDRYPNLSDLANALAMFGGARARRSRDAILMHYGVPAAPSAAALGADAASGSKRWVVVAALIAAVVGAAGGLAITRRNLQEEPPTPSGATPLTSAPATPPEVVHAAPTALADPIAEPEPAPSNPSPSHAKTGDVAPPTPPPKAPTPAQKTGKSGRPANLAKSPGSSSPSSSELFDTTK